jgi:hypothetical protein
LITLLDGLTHGGGEAANNALYARNAAFARCDFLIDDAIAVTVKNGSKKN